MKVSWDHYSQYVEKTYSQYVENNVPNHQPDLYILNDSMAISGTGKNGGTGDMIKCSEDLWISFWHHDFLAFRGLNGWSDLWNPQMLTDLDAGCPLVNVYKTYGK